MLWVQSREEFYDQRVFKFSKHMTQSKFLKGNQQAKNAFEMLKFNFRSKYMHGNLIDRMKEHERREFQRLNQVYNLNEKELPFCIVVPSFNNAKNFRYEFNLQSIFNQDYDNYRVVIVDDNSSDNTTALIKHFLKRSPPHLAQKVVLITNKKQMTAVPNIHMALTKHCKPD